MQRYKFKVLHTQLILRVDLLDIASSNELISQKGNQNHKKHRDSFLHFKIYFRPNLIFNSLF